MIYGLLARTISSFPMLKAAEFDVRQASQDTMVADNEFATCAWQVFSVALFARTQVSVQEFVCFANLAVWSLADDHRQTRSRTLRPASSQSAMLMPRFSCSAHAPYRFRTRGRLNPDKHCGVRDLFGLCPDSLLILWLRKGEMSESFSSTQSVHVHSMRVLHHCN